MKWINHSLIGGGLCAVVNPAAVPLAVLGSTAPDWLEGVLKITGRKVKHREDTHFVAYWLIGIAFFLFLWDWHGFGFWFAMGGFLHVMADSCSSKGVRLGWWSDRRFNLLAGRIKFGSMTEYMFAVSFFLVCIAIALMVSPANKSFMPFFYDWGGYYQKGLIDGHEWKTNRWRFI